MRVVEIERTPLPGYLFSAESPDSVSYSWVAAVSHTGSDPTDQDDRWEYQGHSQSREWKWNGKWNGNGNFPNAQHQQQSTELSPKYIR